MLDPADDKGDISVQSAVCVLETEIQGLQVLRTSLASGTLGDSFDRAVSLLFECQGRIVVSGMGKSGHIAKKIAATFASTGSPAFFVHPAEASHGDLGMVTGDDALVLLSYSGETRELADILAYTDRMRLKSVALTGGRESILAQAVTVPLILPPTPEACPMGLAPTTSTTQMLALGDCLAVSLLEKRQFTPEKFYGFHPGGKLGASLQCVAQQMHTGSSMPLCALDDLMDAALITMSACSFGIVGVVNTDQQLVGVITDGDLRRHMSVDLLRRPVQDIMTHDPQVVNPDVRIGEALCLMNTYKINCLFVVGSNGVPQGVIHIHDCLRVGVA